MKLSSLPRDEALLSVVSAVMKWGPVRLSRVAMETGIPLETCRYYLKLFHERGYRFFPIVDYNAIGLQPMLLILRLSREWRNNKREGNMIKWLEGIYVTYRAALAREGEYLFHLAIPEGEENRYRELMDELARLGVIENYMLSKIQNGYYTASWARYYDFIHHTWREKPIDIEMNKVPITTNRKPRILDEIDLKIIEQLELNPRKTNLEMSRELGISPQLVSYHRQKHIEGQGIITGYVAGWLTEPNNWLTFLQLHNGAEEPPVKTLDYMQVAFKIDLYNVYRIYTSSTNVTLINMEERTLTFKEYSILPYTIPLEHYKEEYRWKLIEPFIEQVSKMVVEVLQRT